MTAMADSEGLARSDLLKRSRGFRVDSPDGRIGFVEDVLHRLGSDGPVALAVRAGLFGKRLLLVSTENVEAVDPTRGRIVLRGSPKLSGTQSGGLLTGKRR